MDKVIEKIKNNETIQAITTFLKNCEAYIVGGYIRDLFLGKTSPDIDIVLVCDDIEKLTKEIAKKLDATHIELDKSWGIYRLVLPDKENYIDFARAVENDIKKDLNRRDITINGIAYDLKKGEFLDPNNGIKDIQNKLIRGISEQNFIDDPLRILRIYRFQSTLGYETDKTTEQWIAKHIQKLKQPAKERVNTELLKLFEGKNTYTALKNMDKTGALELLLPFVKDLKKIPPNSHHHLDLFNHCLETVRQIEINLHKLPEKAQELLNQSPYGVVKKYAFLKLAAFMHDIGKPQTWSIEETGRHRFIKHDSIGAELAPKYLKELKFSKKQISYIQNMIKNHIYPSNVNGNNEKSIMKFLRRMKDDTTDIILLAMSDRLSALGPDITEEMIDNNIKHLNFLLDRYFEHLEEIKPLPKLLTGNEIMEILSIGPSPKLGQIIAQLQEAQEDGEVTTKSEAIEFIKLLRRDNR